MMNIGSQALQVATGLVSVPLALGYVGPERFGLWMALSSALMFISFSDFGAGIGVQDRLASYVGQGKNSLAGGVFLSGFVFVLLLFVLLVLAGEAILPWMDLASILGLKTDAAISDVDPTVRMVIFVIGLGLLAGVVQRAYSALQEGFWVALIQAAARVLSLALLFVVIKLQLGLPALVFVVGGLASAIVLLIGFPFLLLRHRWLLPAISNIHELVAFGHLSDVMKVGGLGLSASIAIYLVNNTPMVLISAKFGAKNVADYAILLKLVGVPSSFLIYLLSPLWSAITDAKTRGDSGWIRDVYSKCAKLVVIISLASSVGLALFGEWIIGVWTGNAEVLPSPALMLACIAFMVIGFWNALNSTLLNGMSSFKGQATYGLGLALAFAVVAALIPTGWGKEYVIWAVSLGYLMRCLLMQLEVRRVIGGSEGL